MLAMLMVVSVVVQYPLNSIAENVQTGSEEYLGVQTEAKVYDDFENDIWLQYQQKEMQVGDTTNLRPWRVEQIISNAVANDVQRPVFHFEIIKGDSISLDTESSTEKAVVTAEKPGTSVVKVTYDAVEYGGKTWGAISPVNTAYAVFTVGETGTATINCSEKLQNWRHYDTIYYNEGDTVPFTFEVSADGAESLKVTLNGLEIQGDGNTYTANLENRSNIIGIEATDADGNVKSLYRVVDARFIEINVENKTNPDAALEPGDTANISFRGVTMPVYKLATIYNPVWTSNSAWGKSDATYLSYSNETLGEFKGQCQQWDLATNNDFDVTFEEAGEYTFTSQNGIFSEWWGSPLGADITANGSGEPNLNAPVLKDWFSTLPSFTVSVKKDVPVENITLDQETLELQVGDVSSLQATVTPADATNQTVEWSSDHTDVVIVDQDGVLNAVSAGKAVITAKAGEKTATCEVTVKEKSEQPEKTPVGTVTVSIQDMIPTPDGEDWPEAKGVILKNTNVSIYEDDSMMDALFISGTYVILPFILYISMNIFLKEQVNVITLGYGNYIEYIFNTDTILTFLSLPYAALRNVAYLFDYSPDWLSIFYWIILCAIALYFAYHYFINRKAEDSEQRTTFWLGYPFIILIITFCMILAVQTARGVSLLVGLTIIFFMYLFLVFFSKRKIVLNIKTIAVFVGLFIGSAAFGQAFQYTHGFGVVQELPQLEKVSSVNIEVVMSQEINHNKTTINGLSLVGKTKNEALNKSIYELHNDVLDVCTDKHEGGSTQITFLYMYRNGQYMSRTYSIGDAVTKGIILPKFDEYHEEAKQGKINASVDYIYNVSNDAVNY